MGRPAALPVPPPARRADPLAWARANLFGSWASGLVTLLLLWLLARLAWAALGWALLHAVWRVPHGADGPDPAPCRAARGAGACWAVIGETYRLILFGRYPYGEQWRPALAVLLFAALYAGSALRAARGRRILPLWLALPAAIGLLMRGGVPGLAYVPADLWGGLPVTLILATAGLGAAFPLAVLLALGRRAAGLPAVRLACAAYVELVRGVPLIGLLFMASVMFPLFLPEGLNPDKLLRAQGAIVLFAAAYLAEVVRAGLQALPPGQREAADALGLTPWQRTRLVVLPQALRLVIPPLVNTFIGLFKDTSLVLVIGILDLLTAGRVALSDPVWQPYSAEVYLVLAAIYFAFCYAMARYSRGLERAHGPLRGQ